MQSTNLKTITVRLRSILKRQFQKAVNYHCSTQYICGICGRVCGSHIGLFGADKSYKQDLTKSTTQSIITFVVPLRLLLPSRGGGSFFGLGGKKF